MPALTLDAALKYEAVEIGLMTNYDHYLFANQAMRGGLTVASRKYLEANTPLIPETYDKSKPIKTIHILDKNSLYSKGLISYLPYGNFRFLDQCEIDCFDVTKMHAEQEKGYLIEVDLLVPDHLHDYMNDFPLACERLLVDSSELSEYSAEINNNLNLKHGKIPKLVATLHPKKNYVTHYMCLKFYIEQGLVLTKIHRILEFSQKPLFKKYIEYNTARRQIAPTKVEQDLRKNLMNSLFGKCAELLTNRTNYELVTSSKRAKKVISKPNFKKFTIINADCVGVELTKPKVVLNKPTIVAICVLEYAKLSLQSFVYLYLKPKFNRRLEVAYSDTDSLFISCCSPNFYAEIREDAEQYWDLSGLPKDHPCYDDKNMRKIDFMKIEYGTKIIRSIVCLKAKVYAVLFHCMSTIQKCKGIPKTSLKAVKYQDYYNILFSEEKMVVDTVTFRSYKHQLYTLFSKRLSLTPQDDKRFVLSDKVSTLAHGHWRTRNNENEMNQ